MTLLLCLLIGLAGTACDWVGVDRKRPFEAAAWKSARVVDDDTPRCAMIEDLLKNHLRAGMTRAEVVKLLGPATEMPKGRGWATKGTFLVYGLGRCPGSIDIDELRVSFDESGALEKAEKVQG